MPDYLARAVDAAARRRPAVALASWRARHAATALLHAVRDFETHNRLWLGVTVNPELVPNMDEFSATRTVKSR